MSARKALVLVLIMAMVATVAGTVDAASAKKRKKKHARKQATEQTTRSSDSTGTEPPVSRKEERRIHKQERKRLRRERRLRKRGYEIESDNTHTEPAKKTVAFKYPPTVMKPRYRVDVLAYMFLDELVKKGAANKIPDKALPGISFYEGLSIAADSLKKAGFSIDIYIHDATSMAESPDTLVKTGALDSSDLIIGAVHAYDVPMVAEYAKKKKINFVSVLSPADGGVKANKYFTLIQPTLKSHCQWILDDIAHKFPGLRVSLLYRTSSEADEHAYKYLTEGDDRVGFRQLNCNTMPERDNLTQLFDTTKPNIVVVSFLDINAADSMLRLLSKSYPGAHFEVYGMPSWNAISDLRKESAFPNLSVNVTSPFNIDGSTPMAKYVAQTYKKSYGGKATEYVYRGFETMIWYASLLKQYGTMFNSNYSDVNAAPFTKFEVKQQRDNEGHILFNENTHIFISKYEGGVSRTE